jgi:hypothetical protein
VSFAKNPRPHRTRLFIFIFGRNFLLAAFFSETIVTIGIMGFGESVPPILWNHRKTIDGGVGEGVRELGLEDSTSLAPSDRRVFFLFLCGRWVSP